MTSAGALVARAWRGLAGLLAEREGWEDCRAESRADPLCNSHEWTLAHGRAFAPDADVFGWTFHARDGRPAAVVALRREPPRGPLALRRALFLADGTFDSDYLEPPVRAGFERALAGALLDAARAVRGIEALVLSGMPEDSGFLAALRGELESRGLPRREREAPGLVAPLPASFEQYVAGLKPRMRTKLRSAVRAAEERGASFAWCDRAEELESHLEGLFRLHELRWKAAGQPGSFADPRRRAFYRDLAPSLLERGALRFARLEREGRPVAYQIGARVAESYYQLQEGYDPELGEERIGTALRARAIERLIAEGVRTYDFMAGDSRHKREWGGRPRPCATLAFALPGWRARLAYGLRALVDRWRRPESTSEVPGEPDEREES